MCYSMTNFFKNSKVSAVEPLSIENVVKLELHLSNFDLKLSNDLSLQTMEKVPKKK